MAFQSLYKRIKIFSHVFCVHIISVKVNAKTLTNMSTNILVSTSKSFDQVLEKYNTVSTSERDKGARFERLMSIFLKTAPQYSGLFKEVYLWNEFPYRQDFGGSDVGIDLVALTIDGDYWAIQCKCTQPDTYIDKPGVDTFLSTSSRQFKISSTEKTGFAFRLWISTSNN